MTTWSDIMSNGTRHGSAVADDLYALDLLRLSREIGLNIRRMRDEAGVVGYAVGRLAHAFHCVAGLAFLREGRQLSPAIVPPNTPEDAFVLPLLPGQVERLLPQCEDDIHLITELSALPGVMEHASMLLLVPLVTEGAPLGVLVLAGSSLRTLQPAEEEMLRLISLLLVSRLREMRLQAQVDCTVRKLAALNDPGQQYTDSLTGLLNQHGLLIELQRAMADAIENDMPLSLLMVQIDRFHALHDYGSPFCDSIVVHIAQTLQGSLRGGDLVACYEEDKFCVLLCATPGLSAVVVAERLRAQISTMVSRPQHGAWHATVSISAASLTPRVASGPQFLAKAQQGLSEARLLGGNQIIFDWDEALELMAEEGRG